MAPKQARVQLDAELHMYAESLTRDAPERMGDLHMRLSADPHFRPTPRQINILYDMWKAVTESGDTVRGMTPYQAALKAGTDWAEAERMRLQEQQALVGPVGWGVRGVYCDSRRWAVVIVPPLAARLHCAAPQSAEMCFADATSSLTTQSDKLVCIYTCASGTAFPLGYLVMSASDTHLLTQTLTAYAELLGSVENCKAFATGTMNPATGLLAGPNILMTDCELAFKNAWEAVFPHSQQLLCHWHLFRAAWQNLQGVTRAADVLADVYPRFRAMVYARSEQDYVATRLELSRACIQHGVQDFWYYLEGQWFARVDEWVLYKRVNLEGWRGHNTNNVCESQFAVIKDFIFSRRRTASYPQFIQRICCHLQAWYRTTLFDRVFDKSSHGTGSVAKHRRAFFRCLPEYKNADENTCQVLDRTIPLFSVRSSTREELYHTVNLCTGYCTCEYGSSGRVCKHQVLAWRRYIDSLKSDEERMNAPCPLRFPSWTDEDRKFFYFLATGRNAGCLQSIVRRFRDCELRVEAQDRKREIAEALASGAADAAQSLPGTDGDTSADVDDINENVNHSGDGDALSRTSIDRPPSHELGSLAEPNADLSVREVDEDPLNHCDDPVEEGESARDLPEIRSVAGGNDSHRDGIINGDRSGARAIVHEATGLLLQLRSVIDEALHDLERASSNQMEQVHLMVQGLLQMTMPTGQTLVAKAKHFAKFRAPSDFADHSNIPYFSKKMNGKKKEKKRKRGDAATGSGACTNRGRRRRTADHDNDALQADDDGDGGGDLQVARHPREQVAHDDASDEEPEDLEQEYPDQALTIAATPTTRRLARASRRSASSHRVAEATFRAAAAPPNQSAQVTTTDGDISDEALMAAFNIVYGRRAT